MGDIVGRVYFLGQTSNQATVDTAFFADSSTNNGDVIYESRFYDSAVNGVSGNLSDCTFFDSAINTGTVTGAATFTNTSLNSGLLVGGAFFNDSTINVGTISSNNQIVFSNSATNTGIISSTQPAVFSDTTVNVGTAYRVQFEGTSINAGSVLVSAVFTENTANSGVVVAGVFRDSSSNTGIVVDSATFTAESINSGVVAGSAVFLDTSTNAGSISGNAAFTGNTSNIGTVGGNAEFQVDILTDDDPDPAYDFIQLDGDLDFLLVSDGDILTGTVNGESISLTSVQLLSTAALNYITINGDSVAVGTYDLYNVAGSVVPINIAYYPGNTEIYNDSVYSYRSDGRGGYYTLPTTRKNWITSIGTVYTNTNTSTLFNATVYTDTNLTVLLANSSFNYGGISYQTDNAGIATPII